MFLYNAFALSAPREASFSSPSSNDWRPQFPLHISRWIDLPPLPPPPPAPCLCAALTFTSGALNFAFAACYKQQDGNHHKDLCGQFHKMNEKILLPLQNLNKLRRMTGLQNMWSEMSKLKSAIEQQSSEPRWERKLFCKQDGNRQMDLRQKQLVTISHWWLLVMDGQSSGQLLLGIWRIQEKEKMRKDDL